MECCPDCIGDRWLKRELFPFKTSHTGNCSYCGNTDTMLVAPSTLSNVFETLIGIYIKDTSGKSLVEWLKDDWAMFPNMDIANSKELLSDILDDGEIVRQKFMPSPSCTTDRLHTWEQLKNELMHENRFFPRIKFDDSRLEELLTQLIITSSELSHSWYRARLQKDETVFSIEEMGAPPKQLSTQGRANPAGIPYLYLASSPETAVSEVRPHTGELASVATFDLPENLKFIDLRNPRYAVSPFLLGDENEIALLRGDIEFLVRLGDELTRPIQPYKAAIDYIPSQYLCEFIKKCSFSGVIYRSSVGDGINLALFNPALSEAVEVKGYSVSRILVEIMG